MYKVFLNPAYFFLLHIVMWVFSHVINIFHKLVNGCVIFSYLDVISFI